MDSLEVLLSRRNETLADLGGTLEDLETYVIRAREGQYVRQFGTDGLLAHASS